MINKVIRGSSTSKTIDFTLEICCACGIPFFMPTFFKEQKVSSPGSDFYCPNGHGQHYTCKTEAQKLREELEKVRAEKEKQEEELQNRWLDALSEKNKLEKKMKRLSNGVCPCCNRSFLNLQQHMKKQHPNALSKDR